MKIVHLMGVLKPSGMERMFVSAARHFENLDISSVIVAQGGGHVFRPELEAAGYRVLEVPSLRSVEGGRAWASILRDERPDVVHIHTERAFAMSAIAAKLTLPKTPIVRTIHSYFRPSGKALLSRKAQAFLADRFVNQFVAVSPDVQRNEKNFGRDAVLIFNWVDDRFFGLRAVRARMQPDEKASAVIVGNSSWIKNQELALRAVSDSDFDLYFHGDESGATPEERSILDDLQASGRLRHRGISDPAPSLLRATVFLMPSRHEGMGIALSEALVTGVPAIVNDAPGLQWAEAFPGVAMTKADPTLWLLTLKDYSSLALEAQSSAAEPSVDLSARRGVDELASVYRYLSGAG